MGLVAASEHENMASVGRRLRDLHPGEGFSTSRPIIGPVGTANPSAAKRGRPGTACTMPPGRMGLSGKSMVARVVTGKIEIPGEQLSEYLQALEDIE